jgi:hypothetical protein
MSLAVRVSENTKMTSTFLHEDKNVPPDEALERDAPRVWLVRVDTKLSDGGSRTKREYECSHCGARQALQTASEYISPLASGETSVLVPGRARKRPAIDLAAISPGLRCGSGLRWLSSTGWQVTIGPHHQRR